MRRAICSIHLQPSIHPVIHHRSIHPSPKTIRPNPSMHPFTQIHPSSNHYPSIHLSNPPTHVPTSIYPSTSISPNPSFHSSPQIHPSTQIHSSIQIHLYIHLPKSINHLTIYPSIHLSNPPTHLPKSIYPSTNTSPNPSIQVHLDIHLPKSILPAI